MMMNIRRGSWTRVGRMRTLIAGGLIVPALIMAACGVTSASATTAAASRAIPHASGVTNNSITIGVGTAEFSAVLAALGPQYNTGNIQSYWKSILAAWKREKITPIDGRNVTFDYAQYEVLATAGSSPAESQRAACLTLDGDHVLAVVGVGDFTTGSDCLATYKIPVLTSAGATSAELTLDKPYLLQSTPTLNQTLTSWPYWAKEHGLLHKGVVLGTYHLADPATQAEINSSLKASLAKLGYHFTVEATTEDELGSPADEAAVERMKAAGVNLVFLLDATNAFLNAANRLNYHPRYTASDYLGVASPAVDPFPANQLNGTLAMTVEPPNFQEEPAPVASAATKACVQNYATYSGTTLTATTGDSGEYESLLGACGEAAILLDVLQKAGKNLNTTTYLDTMKAIDNLSVPGGVTLSFNGSPAASSGVMTMEWQAGCKCYHILSGFVPFPGPRVPS